MKATVRVGVGGRAFEALWIGQTVSALGTQVSMVALPLIAVLVLHAGPFELGILAALETVPYLVLSLPAGVFVDRTDRRRTMIACDVARAAMLIGTGVAIVTGYVSMSLLCVVGLVVGSLSVFFSVAYTSYVATLLAADSLVAGNQRLELSESAAQVIGPTIGGTILQVLGGAAAVLLDGLSYLVSAVAIMASRPTGALDRATSRRQIGLFDGIGEGLRRVVDDRILRDLAGSTAVLNLGSGMILAVVVLFATTEVGLDAAGFGLVYGLGNVGFLLGAMSVGVLTARLGIGRTFAWSTFATAGAMVLIALAGSATGAFLLLAGPVHRCRGHAAVQHQRPEPPPGAGEPRDHGPRQRHLPVHRLGPASGRLADRRDAGDRARSAGGPGCRRDVRDHRRDLDRHVAGGAAQEPRRGSAQRPFRRRAGRASGGRPRPGPRPPARRLTTGRPAGR